MVKIAGVTHWLWRAVDQTGMELDVLCRAGATGCRQERLLRKLLKRQSRTPRVMITDKLARYGAAKREVMPSVEHREHKGLNKRVKNSHQPTRRRERQMKRFKSAGQSTTISRRLQSDQQPVAGQYRAARTQAFQKWAEISSVAAIT